MCGGTHGSRPTSVFVGQGPRALPGVRCVVGGRTEASAPTDALLVVRRGGALPPPAGGVEPRPYGQLGGWYGGPMWASAPTEGLQGVRGERNPPPFRQGRLSSVGRDPCVPPPELIPRLFLTVSL